MIETWAVVVLIVGIVLAFLGAFLTLMSSSLRKPVDVLHLRVDKHDIRIGDLERLSARRDEQIEAIMRGIADLKRLLEKHIDKES